MLALKLLVCYLLYLTRSKDNINKKFSDFINLILIVIYLNSREEVTP